MKKYLFILILSLLFFFNSAQARRIEIVRNEIFSPMTVFNIIPDEKNYPRPLATLPEGTKVKVENYIDDWVEISWYSSSQKKTRHAYISNIALAMYVQDETVDRTKEELQLIMEKVKKYTDEGTVFQGHNEHEIAARKITEILKYSFEFPYKMFEKSLPSAISATYTQRGFSYMALYQIDKALKDFDEAIFYDKNFDALPVYFYKGLMHQAKGQFSKAKECYLTELPRQKKLGNWEIVAKINENLELVNLMLKK